jgi:hypothetical protein
VEYFSFLSFSTSSKASCSSVKGVSSWIPRCRRSWNSATGKGDGKKGMMLPTLLRMDLTALL